jgi:transposase InsO family protein
VLRVSTAAYYHWRNTTTSKTKSKREEIISTIQQIHLEPKLKCYGSPRMHRELSNRGCVCSLNTVAKLMQQQGIKANTAKTFRVATTHSNHDFPIAPNRLNQQFSAEKPNQIWLTDFTYISTKEGFIYLCTILDLFSRKIVGWATSRNIDTQLALAALNQAIALRGPEAGLILHSDRGCQFASQAYRDRIIGCNYLQSMSRKGNCYDNAPMESFFKTFKTEEVYHCDYETYEQATRGAINFIDRFYNCERLHSALGFLSPIQFEVHYQKQLANTISSDSNR